MSVDRRRAGAVALSALCLTLAGCSGGGAAPDAAISDDGGACQPNTDRICDDDGNAYWTDSCGNVSDQFAECTTERVCNPEVGQCCLAVAMGGNFMDAPSLSVVQWSLPAPGSELVVEVELVAFATLGMAQGVRYSGTIDGRAFIFGLKTDLAESGDATGPGLDFFGEIQSEDESNVEFMSPAYFDSKPDNGGIVRLNRPTMLGPRSKVRFRLVREEAAGAADWFALYLTLDEGSEELMGRILFPRASAGVAATLDGESHSLIGRIQRIGAFATEDVGKLQASVTVPTYDGTAVPSASLDYPNLPPDDTPFPNADVTWEPFAERVVLSQGGATAKCTEAGLLF